MDSQERARFYGKKLRRKKRPTKEQSEFRKQPLKVQNIFMKAAKMARDREADSTPKHTPGPCGCCEKKMQTGIGEFPDGIEFCPLHAAAPELLNAAKDVVSLLKDLKEEFRNETEQHSWIVGWFDRYEAAIAKAEGSANA